MKISCISFTEKGTRTAGRIAAALSADPQSAVSVWTEMKSAPETEGVKKVRTSVHTWLYDHFLIDDAIVFVGAVGVAVRLIAPLIQSKTDEPAIVVVDLDGKWAISLLSGHTRGANDLACRIASGIGAKAIVTTSADTTGRFSVDSFASLNHMAVSDMGLAKEVSSAVLGARPIGFYADPLFPIEGIAPEELSLLPSDARPYDEETCMDRPGLGISVSLNKEQKYFENNLALIPKTAVLGVSCRKGAEPAELERFLFNFLDVSGVSFEAVAKVASIDRKIQEPAIRIFCRKYDLSYETYTAQQLIRVPGKFSASSFVEKTIGVDNICERSAVLGAMDRELPGRLIVEKRTFNGMTAALALMPGSCRWS